MKNIFIVLLILSFIQKSIAQDHVYSQYYAAPTVLNPAFAGTSNGCIRTNLNVKKQYFGVVSQFEYISASFDKYFSKLNGGIGLIAEHTKEGEGFLEKTSVSGIYSYHGLRTEKVKTTLAIQAGVSQRNISYDDLVFFDQLDPNSGYNGLPSAADKPIYNGRFYTDFAAGGLIFYKKTSLGFSAKHLSQPDESFTNQYSPLPTFYSAHFFTNLSLNANSKSKSNARIIPGIVYYQQNQFRSFTIGIQNKFYFLNVGSWYRNTKNFTSNDAFIFSVNYESFSGTGNKDAPKYKIGVSYDYTLSKFGAANSLGAIEISFSYETGKCNTKRGKTLCPTFD